ncbi:MULTISPECIES: hypothetical protein [unclassified Streptomyces]|uniref:hypothetical protein n=1 Tax=unclassified Streptomyces TaxID=2593676 RepID=UPI00093CDE04|nr:hypothetical protein [Streptomyces sp. TSRI0281]OKI40722.1 hypothetical protein A6A29_38675 [Streptomyces sp. TSRI0281]
MLDKTDTALLVQPALSWLLPPRHAEFAFRAPRGEAGNGPPKGWRERNWWLRHLPGARGWIDERLSRAEAVVPQLLRVVELSCPGLTVRSVVANGSFLWSAFPSREVDFGVIVDVPAGRELVLEHHPEVAITPAGGGVDGGIEGFDFLVVDSRIIAGADPAGHLDEWCFEDGDAYPYDLRRSTVAAAVRCTYAVAPTLYGADVADSLPLDPRNLLSLAYYFTQEAGILLAHRELLHKAPQRLLEANLIMSSVEEWFLRSASAGSAALVDDHARIVALVSTDGWTPELVAEVQGRLGEERPSLLDRTVRRLFLLSSSVAALPAGSTGRDGGGPEKGRTGRAAPPGFAGRGLTPLFRERLDADVASRVAGVRAAADRAREERTPAWSTLQRRFANWSLADAATHAVRLLGSGTVEDLAQEARVHQLLAGDVRPAHPEPADVIHGLLLWSAIRDLSDVLCPGGELSPSEVAVTETTRQVMSYSACFLDGASALEVLGESAHSN